MKAVWTILLILFLIILFLMLDILFYRPEVKNEDAIEETDHTEEIPLISEDRYEKAAEDLLRSLRYLWPHLNQFLHIEEMDHLLLMQYTSSSKDTPFLFLTSDIDQIHAFFNAADHLMEQLVIYRSFILAVPLSRRFEKQAFAELEQYLSDHALHPSFILEKGGGNRNLTSSDSTQACIITAKTGIKEINVTGAQKEAFVKHILTYPFPADMSDTGLKIMRSFKKEMPWQIRVESRISFLRNKAVKDFLAFCPACASSFQPHVIRKEGRLYLTFLSDVKETLRLLQQEAAKYHVHLLLSDISLPYTVMDDTGYNTVKKAIEKTDSTLTVLPFAADEEDLFIIKGENIIAYTPEGRTSTIRFYENLLK